MIIYFNAQVSCPASTTSVAGADAGADCQPAAGYFGGDGTNAASPCPAGFYCPGDGSVNRCPEGTTSASGSKDASVCSIIRGYFGRCLPPTPNP